MTENKYMYCIIDTVRPIIKGRIIDAGENMSQVQFISFATTYKDGSKINKTEDAILQRGPHLVSNGALFYTLETAQKVYELKCKDQNQGHL